MEMPLEWSGPEGGQLGVQGLSDVLGWTMVAALLFIVPLVVLFSRALRRRRFWCSQMQRDVEAEIEERGLPGFRWSAAVRSCSAFDPPTAVECPRHCLDPAFRRPWNALPARDAEAGRRARGR